VFEKGENEVFEIRTSTGRRLCATANHPILTPEGWKPVEDITEGTLVAAVRSLPIFSPQSARLTADRLRLLRYLIGDGSYQFRRTLTFISNDPRTFDDCVSIAEREFKKDAGLSRRQLGSRLQTGKTLDRPTALARAQRLGAADVEDMATSDVLWDRVVGIAPKGRALVYDLMMPGTHNFIANGITVKNSGEIEQVSDLVVFLYREDYYDQERAQKENKENICELIIAKHRNGPIGTVELYFHKEYSRFANLEKRRQ
jgi:replicative DNA helicase